MSASAAILAAELAKHWTYAMECDHEKKTDRATCACGWISPELPNVGEAALAWANHVIDALVKRLPT